MQRDQVLQDILTVKNAAREKKKACICVLVWGGEKHKLNCTGFLKKRGETKIQFISSCMTDLQEIRRLYVSL